jgi:hypothetical protein
MIPCPRKGSLIPKDLSTDRADVDEEKRHGSVVAGLLKQYHKSLVSGDISSSRERSEICWG